MGIFKRIMKREGGSESAGKRSKGKKVSDDGMTVFAFKAYTPEAAAFAVASRVISTSSAGDLEERIRREARNPGADVIVLEPGEWDAPSPGSLDQADIVAVYPKAANSACKTLSKQYGVAGLTPEEMPDRGAGAMPHPAGHVLFLFAIPGRFERDEAG